jgi:hypothetical protein
LAAVRTQFRLGPGSVSVSFFEMIGFQILSDRFEVFGRFPWGFEELNVGSKFREVFLACRLTNGVVGG